MGGLLPPGLLLLLGCHARNGLGDLTVAIFAVGRRHLSKLCLKGENIIIIIITIKYTPVPGKIIVTALVYECMLSSKRVRERIREGGGGGGVSSCITANRLTIDGRSVRIINIYYHNAIMIFINIYSLY